MTMVRNSLIGLCVAAASLGTFAQSSNEHKDHHPAGSLPSATNTSKAPVKPTNVDKMASMEKQMKAMQAMHEKMASAKTSDERQALMAEHMKMMQEGMGMMKQMGGMSGTGGMQSGRIVRSAFTKRRGDLGKSDRYSVIR